MASEREWEPSELDRWFCFRRAFGSETQSNVWFWLTRARNPARILPREPRPNGDEWVPSGRSSRSGLGYAVLPVQWSQPYALYCCIGAHIVARDETAEVR